MTELNQRFFDKPIQPLQLKAIRQEIRSGQFIHHTSGLAPGLVQANIVILPKRYAYDFLRFCVLNPKPCPLLHVSNEGDPQINELGDKLDIRKDVPKYRVFRHGILESEVTDISSFWQNDFVIFTLGCSFSFEEALVGVGIKLRHIEQGHNITMFKTNIPCQPSGPFKGNLVVTMRPLKPQQAVQAVAISNRFPSVHGAPVHLGDPAAIGIEDISNPDFGDPTIVEPGEIPVFWACGVTPQLAIMEAKPSICITHKPGCMLITGLLNQALAIA
ncbi:putative hydro-lyase [Spartinivicinus ruber]|uniref:putative hydro-lyase n=1 Tax=Spartinivicinus ruber TaxID=2683272 RepID=UPI0013D478D5|nr:putative hydro-lyase [Spartinivicinus ruber]